MLEYKLINIYINLDSAIERRVNIQNNIKKSGLNFIRYPATDGKKLSGIESTLTSSQLGCYFSHLQIINYYKDINEDLLLIEDDEDFNEKAFSIPQIISNIDQHSWDIIYLDATIVEIFDYILISKNIINNLKKNNNSSSFLIDLNLNSTLYGTHAYIVNKLSTNKLITILNNGLSLNKPIDNILSLSIKKGLISAKLLVPTLFYPSINSNQSQITQHEHPLMNDWLLFRNLISNNYFKCHDYIDPSKISDYEESIKKILMNRINYSLTGEFSP